jgi:hypothetical protein
MSSPLPWTLGFEVELLTPRGASRRTFAEAVAGASGTVTPDLHLDTEPSLAPGVPVFHNLTPAFEARDAQGRRLVRVADDLTLQDDLDKRAPPKPGWYRILSDDPRILRLIQRHVDPAAPLERVLDPARALFDGAVEIGDRQIRRLSDAWGASVAMAAPLPGERERPCEVITPPLGDDADARLGDLLRVARGLGCVAPQEGAVHVHVDGRPFQDPAVLARLAAVLDGRHDALRALLGTNPRCRRLGPWSDAVRATLADPAFAQLSWAEARARLLRAEISKYVDLNLRNLVIAHPDKTTVEWRILPVHLDAGPILRATALLGGVLRRALDPTPVPPDLSWAAWCDQLPLAPDARADLTRHADTAYR